MVISEETMKIRTLTQTEKETLRRALHYLSSNYPASSTTKWATGVLLTMVDDLMWIESKEEIRG